MSQQPVVLVVVIDPGQPHLVDATVDSVLSQTVGGLDIVIADVPGHNGARDGRVRFAGVAAVDRGIGRAIDAIVRASTCRYVLFIEAGDVALPPLVEQCIWALETRASDVGIVHPGVRMADTKPGGRLYARFDARRASLQIMDRNVLTGPCLITREACGAAGGVAHGAPASALVWDLWIRCLKAEVGVFEVGEHLSVRSSELSAPIEIRSAAGRWIKRRRCGLYARRFLARRTRRILRRGLVVRRVASNGRGVVSRVRGFLSRIACVLTEKLTMDQVTELTAIYRPIEVPLRLMPNRLKGEWWTKRGLPTRSAIALLSTPFPHVEDEAQVWQRPPRSINVPPVSPHYSGSCDQSALEAKARVLILHPYFEVGGAESVILGILEGSDRRRCEYHLVATDTRTLNPWSARFHRACDHTFYLPAFLDPAQWLQFLHEYIETHHINVLLISLSTFGYRALPQIRQRWPELQILDLLHAEAPHVNPDHFTIGAHYRAYMNARVVTTQSLRVAQIEKYEESAERVEVIPNGIDTKSAFNPLQHSPGMLRHALGIPDGKRIVLYFGRFSMEKQPEHILDIAERMRDREDIVFAMFGGGPLFDRVAREIQERELDNVVLAGRQPSIADMIVDAEILVFPSQREGLPVSGIEGMSMQKCIVASRVPGWLDLIEDGVDGFLVDDGDFDAYALTIRRLIDDRALLETVAMRAREKAVRDHESADRLRDWEDLFVGLAATGCTSPSAGD